jgi:gamma-butyrobetaine dioxygenase
MKFDSVDVQGHRFHTLWLRDNCLCGSCREPSSFQKVIDLGLLPGPVAPKRTDLDDEVLRIEWDETPGHLSVFPVPWLLAHAYDPPAQPDREVTTLWDAETWSTRDLPSHTFSDCDPESGDWADDLARYGFTLLSDVTEEGLDKFVAAIGPVFETEFGRTIIVKSEPGSTDLALTGSELSVHTDFSAHMYTPPLLQFLLCLVHNAEGGDSVLVDGFRAAEELRVRHPDYFELLTRTPVNFQQFYSDRRYFHQRKRPAIEVDTDGSVSGVFFAHSHACNWELQPEKLEAFYAAYHTFFGYLKDPAYQLQIRLGAGQCLAIQNGRLLHGRTAYDPGSGERVLVTEFVAWEGGVNRWKQLR